MKITCFVVLLLLQIAPPLAQAAFYQWTDAQGVVHLTDDQNKIPARYQKKAKELKLQEDPVTQQKAPEPQAQMQPAESPVFGGHDEKWWRESFASLRDQITALQGAISERQAQLSELRRARTIYTRPSDREAMNALEAANAKDASRIAETQRKIQALDQQAAREAVPLEWRR
jgi:chromosome segregation ATPase